MAVQEQVNRTSFRSRETALLRPIPLEWLATLP